MYILYNIRIINFHYIITLHTAYKNLYKYKLEILHIILKNKNIIHYYTTQKAYLLSMQHSKFKLVNYVYSQAITVLNMCYVPRIRGANQVSLRRCAVESFPSEEL